jgi:enoyl-CoA hydratase/carnithine racemase
VFTTLEVNAEGAIGSLWLNRPECLNALSTTVLQELAEAARWFDQRQEVRVVVVGGRGRAFSAGADLDGFPALEDAGVREAADAGRIMADALEGMRAVSIARLHGWCVGGGLVLAAACDLRPALTRELVITCREFDAAEAKTCGFLNRVVAEDELDAEVETLASQVAAKPQLPVAATKAHVAAVTSQMVGTQRSWSDADGLITGLLDPECAASREAYIKARGR